MGKKCKACGERVETAGKLQHQIEMLQAVSKQVDEFWNEADRRFSMEGRAFMEDYAKRIYGDKKFALSAAVHFMWKRDAKVAALEAKLEAAERRANEAEAVLGRVDRFCAEKYEENISLLAELDDILSSRPEVMAVVDGYTYDDNAKPDDFWTREGWMNITPEKDMPSQRRVRAIIIAAPEGGVV